MYTFEWLVRISSIGFNIYCKGSRFNALDTAIVFLGGLDIVLASIFVWNKYDMLVNSILITCLRSVRLMRIFKLSRYWMRFELLLSTMGQTLVDIRSFLMLMGLFIFLYTLMGLEFFQEKAKFDSKYNVDLLSGSSPMFHFDNFLNSIFTVFIVLTNDG